MQIVLTDSNNNVIATLDPDTPDISVTELRTIATLLLNNPDNLEQIASKIFGQISLW